jgi:hypothetical protein
MDTSRVKHSASKAADAMSAFTGHLQDAFDEAVAVLNEIKPETVEGTVEERLKEVEEAVKAIDEIKTQFDETDWDAVTKASEFDPDDFDPENFIKKEDLDVDDLLKKDDLPYSLRNGDFDPDDYVKNDDLPDFDDFAKNDDLPDFSNIDLEAMGSDIDDLKGRMDNLEVPGEKVDELETEVNTLSEKIEKALVEANERIAALEARLAEAEKVVTPLKAFFIMLSAFAPKV